MKCIERPRVVLVPYPAQGHVTPMVQMALALRCHGFNPVIVIPDFIHRRIMTLRIKQDDGIVFMSIPGGLDENEPLNFFTIGFAMENNMPVHLEHIICRLDEDGKVACVVVDLVASWAIEVANRCGVPVAGFWPAMLATYRLITSIPDMINVGLIDEFGIPQHEASTGTGCFLPGQSLLTTADLPWLVGNSASQKSRFAFWIRTLDRLAPLRWLLVNTFIPDGYDSQKQINSHSSSIKRTQDHHPLVVFPVGPLTRHSGNNRNSSFWEEDRSCLDWLDKQKHAGSVIYVSFGSWVGPIGEERINEMALGLEATGRPFIWVLAPMWRKGLPMEYMERIAKQGKLVSWAPQKELLQHEAVGCFLTHCGWNSTMEAIQCGKRLLCYPVSGDQFVNCKYIVKVWGIGVEMHGDGWRDVEQGVRRVMEKEEGKEMQKRVLELKERVLGEKGSSRAAASLKAFVDDLKRSII